MAASTTVIYEPQHSHAQQLQQRIEQLYPQARVSSQQQQLVVRAASAEQASEIAELLAIMDKPIQQFIVTLSSSPQQANHSSYSTRSNKLAQRYSLASDETLTVEYAQQHRDVVAVHRYYGALHGAHLANQDHKHHSLSIQLRSLGPQQVQLDYKLYQLQNGERSRISNSRIVNLDEWLALEGQHAQQPGTISTRSGNAIYILIQNAN
ncbi:hypothetical protein NO559_03480 [Dasania sp. GY-MA-18]|uniref:Uncharacterized protein n=1 Tax=Dasania phycosphaerae TaxID=2950436 RepID=A0A9J6RHU7_9GAMM|nr:MULTISPECIES: hypothetical protein [Dasania]MCR8921818.1 hypothetical protein [Dasania sp. GY-MA-18]MCZ0864246.1 hypothetical protein [Dasania phycosphaerae]MCZ0867974.1 hypothetical protein [Dasania phycosphaerae]